jgi:hypothetical protein
MTRLGMCYLSVIGRTLERIGDGRRMSMHVYTGEKISDDPYVLSSQVSQVYYVRDDRNPGRCCVVRTKPRNVYGIGQGEGNNDEGLNYHESEPLNLNVNQDPNDVDYLNVQCDRSDVPAIEVVQPQ